MTSKASLKNNKGTILKLEQELESVRKLYNESQKHIEDLSDENMGLEALYRHSLERVKELETHLQEIHHTPWYKLLYLRFKGGV